MGIPLKYKVSVWQNRSTNNEIKKKQYRKLLLFIIITDRNECEDIIQSIFLELWEKRTELSIDTSLRSFLLRAVRHDCYDAIKDRKSTRLNSSHIQKSRMPSSA